MGQLGFSEMLMIFVIALLVFGPKKLPELGKSLGKGIREFKKATDELKSSWEDQVKDISQPINDMKRDLHNMGQDFKSDLYKHLDASTTPEPPKAQIAAAATAPETHEASSHPTDSTTPKEHV
jgi:TatA/E family protein of Tat protein translocase